MPTSSTSLTESWWQIPLLACLPALFFLLVFAALIYFGRGRRNITFDLSGLGITLRIGSVDRMEQEKQIVVDAQNSEHLPLPADEQSKRA